MPFWNHVHELRSRLIKSICSVVLLTILGYYFSSQLITILSNPPLYIEGKELELLALSPASKLMLKINISLVIGIVLSTPIILFQIWRFVSPAVNKGISFGVFFIFLFSLLFFVLGAYFSYRFIIPISLDFLTSIEIGDSNARVMFTVESYYQFKLWLIFIGGLIFQLPIVSIIFNAAPDGEMRSSLTSDSKLLQSELSEGSFFIFSCKLASKRVFIQAAFCLFRLW